MVKVKKHFFPEEAC